MSEQDYEPLKITVKVAKMVIPSMPMHLDDLLAAGAVTRHKQESSSERGLDFDSIISRLPLEKVSNGNEWVWKASVLRWKFRGAYMKSITRRLDVEQLGQHRDIGVIKYRGKSVNTMSGPLKSSIDLIPSIAFAEGVAYCIGNKDEVEELLMKLDYVGKKHNRGGGKVIEWRVEPDQIALDQWRNRNLPLALKSECTENHSLVNKVGIRPPYWLKKHEIAYGVA